MSNEEKILAMLEKMQADIDTLKVGREKPKVDDNSKVTNDKPKMSGRDAILAMSKLLDDDEKEALGRYQAEEEARKAALYG
ncbi:MAG: hypothetical protein IJU91_04945 [Selenomonadaceae bacterium]|nr:hypothetical protein [Selenomonadaceae bacterium]